MDALTRFPFRERQTEYGHATHVVNAAMGVKYPALAWVLTSDEHDRKATYQEIQNLMEHHGQPHGLWSGDEWLAGRHPSQGVETCAVVEYMFTLEQMVQQHTGDGSFADILEKVAFNALPASMTPDLRGHQYDQQANQVLCSIDKRNWTQNDETANLFGLEPHYGCCTANLHQGWPKYAASLWMATKTKGGLAAIGYSPCTVHAVTGADGIRTVVSVSGDYPFGDSVHITVDVDDESAFPLLLRVPEWCEGFHFLVDGEEHQGEVRESFLAIDRSWSGSTSVTVRFDTGIRLSEGYSGSVSVERGPLVYSLPVGESWVKMRGTEPCPDWAVHPTTP